MSPSALVFHAAMCHLTETCPEKHLNVGWLYHHASIREYIDIKEMIQFAGKHFTTCGLLMISIATNCVTDLLQQRSKHILLIQYVLSILNTAEWLT